MLTWQLFQRFLFSRRSGALIRTIAWLCISGIGIGIFALIVVISVMNGFNDSIRKRLLAVEPHLVVLFDSQKVEAQERDWRALQSQLLVRHPRITTFAYEEQDVIMRTVDGYFGGAQARGVEPEGLEFILTAVAKTEKGAEYGVEPVANVLEPGEVLVGIDLARSMGIFEGDEITLAPPESLLLPPGEVPSFERVKVRGFLSTKVADIDAQSIYYIRGQTLASLASPVSRQSGVEIRLPEPLSFGRLAAQISVRGFDVSSWKERNSALFSSLQLERLVIGLFLALSALIASFSIFTVLVLLTMQKRQEIGLLMALGLSPRQTRRVFTRLGLMLSGLGLGGGLVLGVAVSLYIQFHPLDVLPDIYYDSRIPARVDFGFILAVMGAATLIAFVASWYPARRVAQLSPVAALRALS